MVASNGSSWWMVGNSPSGLSAPPRSQGQTTLWLTDQSSCVDPLLEKIETICGDPIVRLPGRIYETPDKIIPLIRDQRSRQTLGEVIVLGHSGFITESQRSQAAELAASEGFGDKLSLRMAQKQQLHQFAQQRLLSVHVELSQLCALSDAPGVRELQVTPLFYRPESGAVCCFNETTMKFEALTSDA